MKRRQFLARSSAGMVFSMISPGLWAFSSRGTKEWKVDFKPYRPGQTMGKVYQVTPDDGFFANTYYDICPFSPSQKYLALTRFPYQDKITKLGDMAEVVIIDLEKQTMRSVYKTKVWGYQLGANLHWGKSDRYLYTNDLLNGKYAVCVQLDLESGETKAFDGPIYDFDAKCGTAIGPHLEFMNNSQYSYSTPSPDPDNLVFEQLPDGASATDGLWETDVKKGNTKLLISMKDAAAKLSGTENDEGAAYYFFHTKYSPERDKIMLVVRYPVFEGSKNGVPRYDRNPSLLISDRKGQNIHEILSREKWDFGGHHPNWNTNNEQIIMNLQPKWMGDDTMRFCTIDADNGDIKILSDKIMGSGHPSVDGSGRYLLSDCYPFEPMAIGNGEIPIRLIDLQTEKEESICNIYTDFGKQYDVSRYWGPSKLDAHPVWSRDYKKVCFNGGPDGTRQVFIADLNGVI